MKLTHVFAGLLSVVLITATASAQAPAAAEPAKAIQQLKQVAVHVEVVERVAELVSSPRLAAMIALNALKDELGLKGEPLADRLEGLLKKAVSLPVRNALRFTLKDLYKSMGKVEKAADHLMALILENDEALVDDDHEHDDDDDEDEDEDEDG